MKNVKIEKPYISPDLKRKIAGFASIFLVIAAMFFLFCKKDGKSDLISSEAKHYELVKDYMQSEYIGAYADYFDVLYVDELADYSEKLSKDGKNLEATFLMKSYYRYPYRDPDTVPKVIEARESGDMAEYKKLYDEYNQIHSAEYKLKIEAQLEEYALSEVVLYGGVDDGSWVLLENGLEDYITEE